MRRHRLPNRRQQMSIDFIHAGLHFTMGIGMYEDGRIVELFISSNKPGSPIEALARDTAIIMSIGLQYRADLEVIRAALTRGDADGPASLIGAAIDALMQIGAA